MNIFTKEEKKVGYLELIYDLVFVYMIGRDNSLLESIRDGFVSPEAFVMFVVATLSIIQIWTFTTFYINMFGRNGVRDHIFLLSNMYLMFFLGEATRYNAEAYIMEYHAAWGLILVNIGLQYLIELRNHQTDVWNQELIRRMSVTLFLEAGMVFIAGLLPLASSTVLTAAAIGSGIALTFWARAKSVGGQVDFAHLTERAMLYVVFTFGEMVIAIAGFFTAHGHFDLHVIVYSALSFLIAVGLFLSYEIVYDYLVDREGQYAGMVYMLIHIFIIFAESIITVGFEFMRKDEIDLLPKTMMMAVGLAAYFLFLFLLERHFKMHCHLDYRFIWKVVVLSTVYIVLMALLYRWQVIGMLMSVLYVFTIFGTLHQLKSVQKGIRQRKAE